MKRPFNERIDEEIRVELNKELEDNPEKLKWLKKIFLTTPESIDRFRECKRKLREHNKQGVILEREYDQALYNLVNPLDQSSEGEDK